MSRKAKEDITTPKVRYVPSRYWLLIISLSVLAALILIISSVFHYAYDIRYYETELKKENSRISLDAAINASNVIIKFFKDEISLKEGFFTVNEISHLQDVKNLLHNINGLYLLSIFVFWAILAGIYFFDRRAFPIFLTWTCITAGMITIISIAAIMVITMYDFDIVFLGFHKALFSGNYAFDPAVSNMKAIFSDNFFISISKDIAMLSLIKGTMLLAVGVYLKKKIGR